MLSILGCHLSILEHHLGIWARHLGILPSTLSIFTYWPGILRRLRRYLLYPIVVTLQLLYSNSPITSHLLNNNLTYTWYVLDGNSTYIWNNLFPLFILHDFIISSIHEFMNEWKHEPMSVWISQGYFLLNSVLLNDW